MKSPDFHDLFRAGAVGQTGNRHARDARDRILGHAREHQVEDEWLRRLCGDLAGRGRLDTLRVLRRRRGALGHRRLRERARPFVSTKDALARKQNALSGSCRYRCTRLLPNVDLLARSRLGNSL